MNKLDQVFNSLRQRNQKALIPFFTCGYPTLQLFVDLVKYAADSGADAIEIGIPFSDPLADGPSIQLSSQVALNNRITVKRTMELISGLSSQLDLPLVILSYANPVYQYGLERFTLESKKAGVAGLIMADLVIEESQRLENECRLQSLDLIHLVAPTTNGKRLASIAQRSTGFIYLVSVTGITGVRKKIPSGLTFQARQIRSMTAKPICVGFGISNPFQARKISQISDGVIVGSAIVDLIRASKNKRQMLRAVSKFIVSLKKGVSN